jgi:hypothetical protein
VPFQKRLESRQPEGEVKMKSVASSSTPGRQFIGPRHRLIPLFWDYQNSGPNSSLEEYFLFLPAVVSNGKPSESMRALLALLGFDRLSCYGASGTVSALLRIDIWRSSPVGTSYCEVSCGKAVASVGECKQTAEALAASARRNAIRDDIYIAMTCCLLHLQLRRILAMWR